MTNYRKITMIIARCKDCLNQCELYESGWSIPDDCPLEKLTKEEYENMKSNIENSEVYYG
jgi:hypothetical protein